MKSNDKVSVLKYALKILKSVIGHSAIDFSQTDFANRFGLIVNAESGSGFLFGQVNIVQLSALGAWSYHVLSCIRPFIPHWLSLGCMS